MSVWRITLPRVRKKKGFCVLVMGRILLQFFFLFVWLKAASMSYTDVRFLSDAYFSHSLSKERVADRTFILSGGFFSWSGQEFVSRSTAIRLLLSYSNSFELYRWISKRIVDSTLIASIPLQAPYNPVETHYPPPLAIEIGNRFVFNLITFHFWLRARTLEIGKM